MLPTVCAARSYCRTFSGAFMALLYSPDLSREIRVIRRNFPGHRPAQQLQLFGARRRRLPRPSAVEIKPGAVAHLVRRVTGMHALQAEAPLALLPREKRPPGEQRDRPPGPWHARRAPAGRGNEFDLGHEHAA